MTAKQKRMAYEALQLYPNAMIVGTHALIQERAVYDNLALVITDEQHRFGVRQRETFAEKGCHPHILVMSATPIPRTLAIIIYGDLDISVVDEVPAKRLPIKNCVVNTGYRAKAYSFIENEIKNGHQAYVICPLVEAVESMDTENARDYGLLHGQMKPEQKNKVMEAFMKNEVQVLVSTTVVEVGVNVPNATVMMIENAERFGLAQLHQLRGRVGRSNRKAFAYLLVPPHIPLSPVARRRLQAIESFSDLGSGIHIAMQDLDIRGAGNLLGAEQSGFIADLGYETYQKILKEAVTELRTEEFAELDKADRIDEQEQDFVADCVIESDMELLLPADYVPTESERISLYQELDGIEREIDLKAFSDRLTDRFGTIPAVTAELLRIPRLRRLARRLGIEKVSLKQGKMYTYFVDESNKAYYQSEMFGKMLNYLTANPRRVQIRERNGKRSFAIANVDTVETAVDILQQILG